MRGLAALAAGAAALSLAGCTERAPPPAPPPAEPPAPAEPLTPPAPLPSTAAPEPAVELPPETAVVPPPPVELAPAPAPAPVDPPPPPAPEPEPERAAIVVVDGDTRDLVAGATVAIGSAEPSQPTAADGRAAPVLPGRGYQEVSVSAPGYLPRTARLRFGERRSYQVRVFREELQWPVYGGTPARTQVHPAIDLRPPFRTVWSRGLGSLVEFPALVWEGVAYVTTLEGWLYALAMRDGDVLWRTRVGTRLASSPGLAPDRGELVVVTMSPGDAKVVDMRTGEVRWKRAIGRAEPSPAVVDGVAFLAGSNGLVTALDLETRRPRWTFDAGAKVTSSPALLGGTVYVGDYAGRVHALDAATGERKWVGSAGSRVYGTVAVAGGTVYAPSVFSGLSALDRATGKLRWRIPTGAYLYSSPAAYRGRVFFGDYAGRVRAADARTGRVVWTGSAGGEVSGAVQVVAGIVYAGSFAGRITGWDWRTGREVFRFGHGQYVPVSGNGGRLLLHGYSRVYAVEPVRKGSR